MAPAQIAYHKEVQRGCFQKMEMSIPGLGSIAPEFPGFVPTNTWKIAVEAGKAQQSLSVRLLRRQRVVQGC